MNERKPKPGKAKFELREPAKPLAQPEARELPDDHPMRLLVRPAVEANQLTSPVDQSTTLDDQLTTAPPPVESFPLVNQSTSQPVNQSDERFYPSRVRRRLKGIRLPADKLERYEDWQHENRKRFPDFQSVVEYAMDWLTSQPVDQLTSQPVNQSTALITNDLTNLVINDEKAKRALARFAQVAGRQPTQKDLEAYGEVSHLPIELIEQGIDETGRRAAVAGKPYNGFRYGLNVIRELSKTYQPPVTQAEPERCDLCRELNGFVNVYKDGQRVGVTKCTHGRGK